MAPNTTSTLDRTVAALMADPEQLTELLEGFVATAAYLAAKAEWSMEDNFSTTEALASNLGAHLPDEDLIAIATDGGYDLPPEHLEKHLLPFLPRDEEQDEA